MTLRRIGGGSSSSSSSGADELELGTSRTRRARIAAFVTRAVAGGELDSLCLLADGASEPVWLAPVVLPLDPDAVGRLVDELAAALEDDAASSRGARYRLLAQARDATLAVLALRLRVDVTDHPIDASLRRAGETAPDALIRQLMRHQEGLVRLMMDRDARRAEAELRREERIAARLEELERRAAEAQDRRVDTMRAEAELTMQMTREERRDALERAAVGQLLPAVGRLAQAWAAGGMRALPAPSSSSSAPPSSPSSPSSSSPPSSTMTELLGVVGRLDEGAVEALAAFLPADDAAVLRRAWLAARRPAVDAGTGEG